MWTTLNGTGITIANMTNAHLRNCIFYLHRQRVLIECNRKNSMYINVVDMNPRDTSTAYDIMLQEADRRGLPWVEQ